MNRPRSTPRRWGRGVLAAGNGSATLLVFAMMCLMVVDVAGRELFNSPLTGATELIEICLVGAIFACLPVICWQENHIVADVFDHVLGPRTLAAARIVACLIGATMFALAAWQLAALAERATLFNDQTAQLHLPLAWIIGFMSVFSTLAALAFLLRAGTVLLRPETQPGTGTE